MSQEIIKMPKLFYEIKSLISEARIRVAVTVNAELSMLYWHIGNRINSEILQNKRAEYGRQIITNLPKELTSEFGKGWSKRHLHHCLRIAQTFPDKQILHTLCAKLSCWNSIKVIFANPHCFVKIPLF